MLHRRLLVPLAVVPFAVATVMAGTASAADSPSVAFAATTTAATPAEAAATVPGVSITKVAGKVKFSRATLNTHKTPKAAGCTMKNAGFKLTNTTAVAQTLKVQGKPYGKLPAHKTAYACGYISTITFGLVSNPNAKLVVHFS